MNNMINMIERLYQPDFTGIFGKTHSSAFLFRQADTLVWPVFNGLKHSNSLQNLKSMANNDGRELFYCRKISIDDELVELNCSGIDLALLQAMDLDKDYGIDNMDVIRAVNLAPSIFKAVLSYNPQEGAETDIIQDLRNNMEKVDVVGIALYPSFIKLDLNEKNNDVFNSLLNFCRDNDIFIKIDVGNSFLPDNDPKFTSPAALKAFFSKKPGNIFILSGLDLSGDFLLYYQMLKYFNNLWVEIDPRSFGGMTPTDCFQQIFSLKGFIQNAWHRLVIGSATPTLEISQMVRGFTEATESLSFAQKCILRTWAFRNVNRLSPSKFSPLTDVNRNLFTTILDKKIIRAVENENEVNITWDLHLRSFSITQLLYITGIIKDIFNESHARYPDLKNGELFLRSYHTTTSLIINEHEHGNYLDLHYMFAEISRKSASNYLHTVRALENRADFNHFDHELASTYGSRQLTIPIINGNLALGGRENFYVLVTFGPRTFKLLINIRLLKNRR